MEQYTPPFREVPGKGLGIASLVLGILAVMFAFIPCVGLFSLLPAIVAIILGAISLSESSKVKAGNGIAVAGLVCAIIACLVAGLQIYFLNMAGNKLQQNVRYFENTVTIDTLNSNILDLEIVNDSLAKENEE